MKVKKELKIKKRLIDEGGIIMEMIEPDEDITKLKDPCIHIHITPTGIKAEVEYESEKS